ncbi:MULTISPECIES: RrF2 family transcriptional regulator [Fervidobacterium]|uniref:Transcriptional regulator, BadM/Rrf2 family n=1 Tax=Fervidobacterium nodosum (strain ATCC 35602 / DSM 5306 / Rt17-B1) TaxID=381764 RepID=A7HNX1_FERNB|nr:MULTISPECIES: Rrf2 family transcriptional regulator [Fervidobacterium]ABS61604.1 transcriptional regulator, BadM/Rrf2 family [Fervidobacterium nodosum Rt17-B1]KAF2961853.1 Rrf2 family transcriptional regulator [Fervidobacterium sp. 2310opik-2]PHJ14224.1 Rrf2 family transcriptional regulator [Fervidobacterium sp. SC_NGM5_G05]
MAITMKSEYAIKIMILIAVENKRVNAREIVKKCRERLPLEFAEKILADLARNGILHAYRGRGGGYELAKKLDEITVYDVVSSVDNPSDTIKCFVDINDKATSPESCTVNKIWESVLEKMQEILKSITLKELTEDYLARCQS